MLDQEHNSCRSMHSRSVRSWWLGVILLAGLIDAGVGQAGTVTFHVQSVDGQLLPCRIHLQNSQGVAQRAEPLPFWHDHFVCPGQVELDLPPETYTYEIERGPEYRPARGEIVIGGEQDPREIKIQLERIADLTSRHWWSGELHVHRDPDEMPLHMQAEDLHVAPVITWWNGQSAWTDRPLPTAPLKVVDDNRYYHVLAGEDERNGGALLYFGLAQPLPLVKYSGEAAEYPSPLEFVAAARTQAGAWIDIEKPFWQDVPVWLANAQFDSIGLANNHMCRSTVLGDEAWGKARDVRRLPPPYGNGLWSQEIYGHILNSGFRLPPSAGSASGVLPNPVGYNRVYVYLPDGLTPDAWWQGLRTGRSFVTNGPLLLCQANGQPPGHTFTAPDPLDIELQLELAGNDRVPELEIVVNGETIQRVSTSQQGPLIAKFTMPESGWFLVRAVADHPRTFRFASTAPYYVEIGGVTHRISRRSAQFFLDWVNERAGRVSQQLQDPTKLREVLRHHDQARDYWQRRISEANVE